MSTENTNKLKILVIDDTSKNLDSAKEQLGKDYDLTLCSSYDEAQEFITQTTDANSPHFKRGEYYFGHDWKEGEPWFDVILTDLFMPASLDGVNGEHKQEIPYGLVFAMAAIRRGTKMVGIVTNADHHTDPLLWALDLLGCYRGDKMTLGSSKLVCHNSMIWDGKKYTVKDWKKVLDKLIND